MDNGDYIVSLKEKISALKKEIKLSRERIEKAQEVSSKKISFWKKALENIPVNIFISGPNRILWCNNFMEENFGYSRKEWTEFTAKDFISLIYLDKNKILKDAFPKISSGANKDFSEINMKGRNGNWHWYYITAGILDKFNEESLAFLKMQSEMSSLGFMELFNADNDSSKSICALVGIDNRKKLEKRFLENEEKYRALVSGLSDLLLVFKNNKAQFGNDAAVRVLEYNKDEITNLTLKDIIAEDDYEKAAGAMRSKSSTDFISFGEVKIKAKSGIEKQVFMRFSKTVSEENIILSILLTDLSFFLESRALQEYSSKLILAQESERRRISRELHDNILQMLMSIISNVDYCKSKSKEGISFDHSGVKELIDNAIKNIRKISHDLHPVILEDLGFHPAVKKLIREFKSRNGGEIEYEFVDFPENISPEINISLFRILQEIFSFLAGRQEQNIFISCHTLDKDICIKTAINKYDKEENISDINNPLLKNLNDRVKLINGDLQVITNISRIELIIKIPF